MSFFLLFTSTYSVRLNPIALIVVIGTLLKIVVICNDRRNVDASEEIVVTPTKLPERQSTRENKISYDYSPAFRTLTKRDAENTCYGLRIRCKPILDKKLNVHLRIDPQSNERRYLWPWEVSIYVNGYYRCPAILLDDNFLLGSLQCSEGIK